MYFREFLKQSATDINAELEAYLSTWSKEIVQMSPRLTPLATTFYNAALGGKRIRGTLVLLGYVLVQPKLSASQKSDLLRIAVAYEIFQTAILAHDDIIDKSPLRRGKPSLYKQLGGTHYGLSHAISLGDLGFFLAYKIIADCKFPEKEKNKAISYFSHAIHETVVGQLLDIEFTQQNSEITEEDILEVARLKTAYYTFIGPLTLGAVLGGANDDQLQAIKTFGENIGIAFQVRDDIQDVFGTHEILKKEVGGDIREGKNTILYLKAKEKANKEQFEVLKTFYGNAKINPKEMEAVKQVFNETRALDYAESLVKKHSEKAQGVIGRISEDETMRSMLMELIEYVNDSSSRA